ncbi:hypothetical protein Tco_0160882 [Tanacetum coccineum]
MDEEGMIVIPLEEQPPHINHTIFITALLLLQDLYTSVVTALHNLATMLRLLLPKDGVVLPHPTLNSIIMYLLGFVAIKAQCHPDFPYIKHHKSILAAVICVVMFGVTSATEHIATRVYPSPLYCWNMNKI